MMESGRFCGGMPLHHRGPGNLPDVQAWVRLPNGLNNGYHVATIRGTDVILQQNSPKPRQALQKRWTGCGCGQSSISERCGRKRW